MKPAPFEYFAPETAEEALALMAEHGVEARPLAGGQSLVPLINMRMAQPSVLIDLNRCPELAYLRGEDGMLVSGPMTRQRELELSETVRAACPLIAKAMPYMGHATIRNRGTAGGSLSHADPSAELPGVALALGAEMIAGGPNGRRTVPATEFFFAELTTALEPDEMLCEIRFPEAPAGSRAAFAEVGSHFGGLALVGVAAQIDLDSAGRCTKAALAATGAGERPTRLSSTEAVLTGEVLEKQSIAEAAEAAAGDVEPLEDLHATAHWRRRAAVAMAARVLHEIADEAGTR
ncbi:MAG: FAD binding domain-containing protein [Alphaproteobacteria bacterium]|nr:FAD binding domain-containing protein [Alphaproteobacteria bacterium]